MLKYLLYLVSLQRVGDHSHNLAWVLLVILRHIGEQLVLVNRDVW